MQLQLFENKGDLMIVIKDAPKGTKEQLEKMFADYAITELKGLVKPAAEEPPSNENWRQLSEEEAKDVPFSEKTPEAEDVITKSDYKNDNVPFSKPEKEDKKGAYNPFE